jgi:transposase
MSESRRVYTAEFKLAAVKLATEQGRSVAEAARSLGVSEKILRKWKLAFSSKGSDAFPGHGCPPAAEAELRRLLEENRRLRMERDILKKATAFFAKESL